MIKIAAISLNLLLLFGCVDLLPFGEDIEKSGSEIGQTEFDTINSRLSITLPPGTTGIEYRYIGSGIDDSLRTKLFIPEDELREAQAIVQQLLSDEAMVIPDDFGGWLDTDSAEIVIEHAGAWSEFNYGSAVLTKEGGEYFLYLYWFTT